MFFKKKFFLQILVIFFFANISFAQQDKMNELLDRLEKIQKDIQTLEKAVYSKNPTLSSDNVIVNEALTRQLTKISELEKQIQEMTSKFEENNYKIQQLSDRLNRVSNDNQIRLQQLENNKVVSDKVNPSKEVTIEKKTPPIKKNETNILNSEEVIVEEEISSDKEKINQEKIVESENIKLKEKVNKPKTKVLPKVSISEQYKYAMNIMKSGDFEKAEIAFKEFVDTHSKHELAGSAQFWYAETFYIRQLYDDAAVAFLEGYQKYPNSPKAPENLLKLGVTLAELGEIDQGCKMIMNLKKAYPKTDASILQKSSYEKKRFNCS
ncbi:MAG: tol-pal system protein YbgF [Proteobacteria bacterium]|jgi:tol-pal system protein YbgF|nr:tol-pal system protein YbgF [Chloroflexota bacterium]NKA01416.1 tol-pal system protein YbgF [Candidatus Fonsibacter sp. PEL5]NKA16412.1 tol-pal system protein YbgF [Candidatus Fonsibacter sp. PEL55]